MSLRLVTVVYISRLPATRDSGEFKGLAKEFRKRFPGGSWPYDIGDDPAFFSAQALRGPVTWGVCRQDVRNQLVVGDVVAFFAMTNDLDRFSREYRFVAALTVDRLLNMDEVFQEKSGHKFDEYLNLLVRPAGGGWEHVEPALPRDHWHDDWMWRICDHTGYKKEAFMRAAGLHRSAEPLHVAGSPTVFAPNYIVFSTDPKNTLVMTDPEIVAVWQRGSEFEEWLENPVARELWSLTLSHSSRDHLRTRNKRQPHRHVWANPELPRQAWFQKLRFVFANGEHNERPNPSLERTGDAATKAREDDNPGSRKAS